MAEVNKLNKTKEQTIKFCDLSLDREIEDRIWELELGYKIIVGYLSFSVSYMAVYVVSDPVRQVPKL
tara:strand:+ start:14 stop:214 length:201 start_codon:yes stop_codon:yes gene_type:complete